MTYNTTCRYGNSEFIGVPVAKLYRKHWYWPDYETARNFAEAFGLPCDRIIPYKRGWAIQLYKSGPYIGSP